MVWVGLFALQDAVAPGSRAVVELAYYPGSFSMVFVFGSQHIVRPPSPNALRFLPTGAPASPLGGCQLVVQCAVRHCPDRVGADMVVRHPGR